MRRLFTFRGIPVIEEPVFYQLSDKHRFDIGYYLETHIPLAKSKITKALTRITAGKGIPGAASVQPGTYARMVTRRSDLPRFFSEHLVLVWKNMADVSNGTEV
jgi:hypothetical protein